MKACLVLVAGVAALANATVVKSQTVAQMSLLNSTVEMFSVCAQLAYVERKEGSQPDIWSKCQPHYDRARSIVREIFPEGDARKEAESSLYLAAAKIAIVAANGRR